MRLKIQNSCRMTAPDQTKLYSTLRFKDAPGGWDVGAPG
jgi:hypothetical protein